MRRFGDSHLDGYQVTLGGHDRSQFFELVGLMKTKLLLIAGAALAAALISSGAQATGVINGDFSANNTGFTSGYGYLAPAGQGTLYPEGKYTVDTNPNNVHDQWASFGDHTTGSGLMMIINGATVDGVPVWGETGISVAQNTTYYFSTWVASSHPASPAILDFSINGSSVGGLNASSTTGLWQQFYTTWFSGSNTSVDLALVNHNTAFSGNDFALDDIAFGITKPGVPEPATWALMLGGFGLAGVALRRRRLVAA